MKIHMGGLWDPKNKIRKIGGDSIYSGNRDIGDDIIIMNIIFTWAEDTYAHS